MFDIGNTESTSLAWLKVLLGGTFRRVASLDIIIKFIANIFPT